MIYRIIRKYNYNNFLDLLMSKENELDPIEEIEEVEEVEQNEESDYEDEVEQEDLKVYVPISLDDSYFGAVKKISFERMSFNNNLELEDGVEPVGNLEKESVDMEITIPKGAMIGEYQIFKNQGNTDSNNKTGDLVFIYIDEDECEEGDEDECEEGEEDECEEGEEDECEEGDEDECEEGEEDECEEGDEDECEEGEEDECEEGEEDESSYQSTTSSIPKKKKYDFVRGQNNNLEITFPISLKEYYFGVERSIKYFGDKQLNLVYPFNIDTHASYVLNGHGINGADFIVHFELELPDEIPKEYEKEFSALLDKICVNHNIVDFKKLDPADINILDKCESESEDEEQNYEDSSQHHVPSCAQQ